MRLNRQSEVAIAVLAACALAGTRKIRTADAATAALTTREHAAKIVCDLTREGLVSTTRGRAGGISLALPAREILLGDVLRRMQPDLALHVTGRGNTGAETPEMAFASILGAAEATFLTFMDRFTIADLVSEGASAKIDCLGCGFLSPARRRQSEAEAFTDTLYNQKNHTFHEQKGSDVATVVARHPRTQGDSHKAYSSR